VLIINLMDNDEDAEEATSLYEEFEPDGG